METTLRPAQFTADWLQEAGTAVVVAGFTDGSDWNGWACPWFERVEAERVVAALASAGRQGRYDAATDAFCFPAEDGLPEPECFAGEDCNGRRLYPVGAWSWTWDEVEEPIAAPTRTSGF